MTFASPAQREYDDIDLVASTKACRFTSGLMEPRASLLCPATRSASLPAVGPIAKPRPTTR